MSPIRGGFSEKELGEKYDRCITDTLIKIGGGIGVGAVFSLVLFQRKSWPVAFGLGTGFGMAYSNCQNEFRRIYPLPKLPTIVAEASPVATE